MYDTKTLIDTRTGPAATSDPSASFRQRSQSKVSAYRCPVADDDPAILQLVAEVLSELNFQVDTAEDGRKAFIQISSHRYDLVLTDLEMPEMNGFLVASSAKSLSNSTRTVIMTGHSNADSLGMRNTTIVDAWLFKPFQLNELCRILGDLKLSVP